MQVYKFLDKNYDQVRQDVLDLFIQSKNKVRVELKLLCVNRYVSAEMCVPLYMVCENMCVCFGAQMVSNLFLAHAETTGQQRGGHMRKSSSVTRKYQAPTVSGKFQQSLLELVEKMER